MGFFVPCGPFYVFPSRAVATSTVGPVSTTPLVNVSTTPPESWWLQSCQGQSPWDEGVSNLYHDAFKLSFTSGMLSIVGERERVVVVSSVALVLPRHTTSVKT